MSIIICRRIIRCPDRQKSNNQEYATKCGALSQQVIQFLTIVVIKLHNSRRGKGNQRCHHRQTVPAIGKEYDKSGAFVFLFLQPVNIPNIDKGKIIQKPGNGILKNLAKSLKNSIS